MHQRLLKVTQDLEQAQDALLEFYATDRLYDFRVASRRIRSILKQSGDHRSRAMRKTWGGLAAVTGNARDWDVFLATVKKLLEPGAVASFRHMNQDRITASRTAVIEMLESSPWRRHLLAWEHYLETSDEKIPSPELNQAALDRALEKARRRLLAAWSAQSDRSWHKFRIAVKEVRYVAEARPAAFGSAEAIKTCKKLQTRLGDWHDTVVQLNLLDELQTAPVHEELTALIQARNKQFLSQIRDQLARDSLFSLPPA
ncbi:MAG: CHAD domain-containing protein [Xanthomonadales bacterium]|jgi:CHAD domain-containing protein|nr:CHAD domain-containing protein [Xanthomonadales bacterium]